MKATELKLQIPTYNEIEGLRYHWENGFEIKVISSNSETLIRANKEGLISLAIQLLTLAQDNVPVNNHLHFDEYNSLNAGSKELIIQKV